MEKVITLEEALKRIEELENENAKLREELEYYKNRKLSGRQKHNAKWMAIYNDFVAGYESGMTMLNDIEDFLTANLNSKSRYNPHVFTEQGLYMLMTVLKGPLAVKQSKALIRTFKI